MIGTQAEGVLGEKSPLVPLCLHKSHIYFFDPRPFSIGHDGCSKSERRRPVVYPARSRWGNVSRMLFQEGRSSNLWLRRGVRQAAHTRSNPHMKCIGVYCVQTVNNGVTGEIYGVLLSG